MRALKAFVVIAGILIIVGFTFVGIEIYRRSSDPTYRTDIRRDPAAEPNQVWLDLPQGTRLGEPVVAGNRIVVKATTQEEDRLYIIDPRTGALVAGISTRPAPSGQ